TTNITYGEYEIDLAPKWTRIHMVDAVKEHTGVDFWKEMTDEKARSLAKEHNIGIQDTMTYGHVVNEFFEQVVEERLIEQTFNYCHLVETASVGKSNKKDQRLTDRIE